MTTHVVAGLNRSERTKRDGTDRPRCVLNCEEGKVAIRVCGYKLRQFGVRLGGLSTTASRQPFPSTPQPGPDRRTVAVKAGS
jgi:hypothetical protein